MRRFAKPLRIVVAIVALAALAVALWQLHGMTDGLRVSTAHVGETPVTIYRPASDAPAPVVVIAHGFAGSQQLMQPFADTLARNGYIAVTFDFTGHGRNPVPIRGDIDEPTNVTGVLVAELGRVTDFARTLPDNDGRVAVLGHSMASDIVVQYAVAHPEISATVAVSVFTRKSTATLPHNLLVIVGALEPQMLKDEGLRIVNQTTGGGAVAGRSYGDFNDGSARRLALSSGVEHIGVLYSRDSMREALQWMNESFGRTSSGWIDRRPSALGLLFFGLIALAWPLSTLLPKAAPVPMGASLSWKQLLIAAILPAVLTPLILWKAPTDFLIILLGDYLTLHFLLYGLLTGAILLVLPGQMPFLRHGRARPGHPRTQGDAAKAWMPGPSPRQSGFGPAGGSSPGMTKLDADSQHARPTVSIKALVIAAAAVAAYNILAFGLPLDTYVFSFLPIEPRIHLIAAVACGTVPYFLTAEWMAHGAHAPRGGYAFAKFCFLASLAAAVALNLHKLFFLIIIVPAILLLFLAFGLISNWSYRATNHPLPGALANAAIFAWAIAVTFPMVIR
ncbi:MULTISPECIES: alpha/beta fold hydrolase [Rhodopseudomonas]|uniref:Dienelactone hydrolase n=1 Tax=Rhodopseudomonas palustris TaxID=1076 RepID=A0A0D7EB36_RHOPL|nr:MULTISPECIES: alpha/beta fold hydrolase [Rhodopseudomonas]KIZ37933.1 dienelactone hydrolase [Rhodopseudomonas palustris]MDF3814420.1 alpha/beta fold hydrolase [Rhodopseudomonas sp. BAL398]WOK17843.1 alpha/beta fold hydrolase [Rhodopseudomonas sp. BAL398]